MVFLGSSIIVANLVGFLVGSLINVVLIRQLVFTPKFKLSKDVLLTWGLNGFLFLLGTLFLWWLVSGLEFNAYVSKLGVNGLTFVCNFITRVILFRGQ